MRPRFWQTIFLGVAILFPFAAHSQEAPPYQTDFPPEEFQARWAKIFDKIGDQAVAVVQGVAQTNGFIVPRQSNEFYYLCGVETPHSYLLLDARQRKVTLYLPPRNARLESAEGKVLSAADADLAKQLTGVDEVQSTDVLRGDWLGSLPVVAGQPGGAPRVIYALFSPAEGSEQSRYELLAANASIASDYWDGRLPRETQFVELLRTRYPRARVLDLTPILDELRSVKSPREIALIRRASQLAGLGVLEAIRSTRPGVFEYQLDAAARYIFLVNGARLEGYRSIIAAGTPNIWNMHYYRNTGELHDGDLVLMDYAPDYHYYTSDVGRMWPVNGKYSDSQRELVGFVLAYRNEIMKRIRPGATVAQIREEAKAAMEPVFARTKFSKPVYEQAARQLVNTGGGVFSHPVGLAVHDDGNYASGPLQPGHVFSIDPQLRVPEENLYIRYEDTIVITESGYENLMEFLPTELADLEKLVGQQGIVQKVPPTPRSPERSRGAIPPGGWENLMKSAAPAHPPLSVAPPLVLSGVEGSCRPWSAAPRRRLSAQELAPALAEWAASGFCNAGLSDVWSPVDSIGVLEPDWPAGGAGASPRLVRDDLQICPSRTLFRIRGDDQ